MSESMDEFNSSPRVQEHRGRSSWIRFIQTLLELRIVALCMIAMAVVVPTLRGMKFVSLWLHWVCVLLLCMSGGFLIRDFVWFAVKQHRIGRKSHWGLGHSPLSGKRLNLTFTVAVVIFTAISINHHTWKERFHARLMQEYHFELLTECAYDELQFEYQGKNEMKLIGGMELLKQYDEPFVLRFGELRGVEKLEIPEGIKNLKGIRLNCSIQITSVTIPEGLQEFRYLFLTDCSELSLLKLPDEMVNLLDVRLKGCQNLKKLELPEACESLASLTLEDCGGLTSLRLPRRLNRMTWLYVTGCSNLKELDLPREMNSLETLDLMGCGELIVNELPRQIPVVKTLNISGCGGVTKLELPNGMSNLQRLGLG